MRQKSKKSVPKNRLHSRESNREKKAVVFCCLFLAAIVVLLFAAFRKMREANAPLYYQSYVARASEEFGVPQEVIFAVIRAESNFRSDAESSVGARGLMQITAVALEDINQRLGTGYSFERMFEPEINIRCGTCYLAYLFERFGDYEIVFAAYNAGPTTVSKWLKDARYALEGRLIEIPYAETARYVQKVENFRKEYHELYEF